MTDKIIKLVSRPEQQTKLENEIVDAFTNAMLEAVEKHLIPEIKSGRAVGLSFLLLPRDPKKGAMSYYSNGMMVDPIRSVGLMEWQKFNFTLQAAAQHEMTTLEDD